MPMRDKPTGVQVLVLVSGFRRIHADARSRAGGAQDHAARLNCHRRSRLQARHAKAQEGHVVHKANVLRVSDGLYLECLRTVAARYPQIEYEERIIDVMAALLVRDASQFDVIVTTNMLGDIFVRRGERDRRQSRARRLAQCRQRSCSGAGPARLGARHRGQEHRQPFVADRLGRRAARLAGRTARRQEAGARRRRD